MVALGAGTLAFSVHEPAKVPVAVEEFAPPPGLSLAPPPGLDAGAAAASTRTLREAVRQLALENDRLKKHLCPDVARLGQENEELRAMILTSCAHYGMFAQAAPQTTQTEWTGGEFIPASEAGAGSWPTEAVWPVARRRRRGCRGGTRAGRKLPLRDALSEVSTEEGQPSEQSTVDSPRDDDSDLELIEIEDESGAMVDLTVA